MTADLTPERLRALLLEQQYLCDHGLATALHLALALGKPLLLEGEAGVGKTEVARALAAALSRRLIRLQCYEGIDVHQALYDWNYPKQFLHLRRLGRAEGVGDEADDLFGTEFLVERPLLTALRAGRDAVLLIDEIDRADDEFEAFLLEVLADFAVTIPELGTVRAAGPPVVVLTSNRTRDLHDALKRRCLYHWIEYPTVAREIEILRLRVPALPERLTEAVATAVQRLRELDLVKPPGIAEAVDWARSLEVVGAQRLTEPVARDTIGAVAKVREDVDRVAAEFTVMFAGE